MSRTFRFAVLCLFLLPFSLMAQYKTFTIDDMFKNRNLFPASLANLQFVGSSHDYSYTETNALFKGTLGKEDAEIYISLEKLSKAITAAGGEAIKKFPSIQWIDNNSFHFISGGDMYIYQCAEGKAIKKNRGDKEAENFDVAPTTLNLAYTLKNNLYVSVDGKSTAVTKDPDTGIVSGKFVHRNEWGIDKGTFWSPKGDLLAFYHMDESMVTQYPLVDIEPRPAELKYVRYPMAGMKSHQVTVAVYDPKTQKTVYLETGEPKDQFLTNVTWTPDEKSILIAVLNREQNHMWMRQYDVSTGKYVKTIFEETDPKYVEPLHKPVFLTATPTQFIWQSRRDGYNHLYLYDLSGLLIRQLTSGKWEVMEFLGLEANDQDAWFMAGMETPISRHLYKINLKDKTITYKKVSEEDGTHDISFASDFDYYFDYFSNLKVASVISINDKNGKPAKELIRDVNPLAGTKAGTVKIGTLKSTDGTDLYYRMIKPADFDSSRKYPTLIYVYGGPHSQMVTNSWLAGAGLFLTYLSTKGYLIFTLDNRGTANRGRDFEQAIHRHVGEVELQDQKVGLDYLKSLQYVDNRRMGVYGWSYGGFLSISMLLQYPNYFKMGMAGGPVCDWKYYEVMYGERYMDTPQENPDGYEQTSLVNRAELLKSDLLIIHGTMDETVVMQNSLSFLRKCIDNGILVDYFVYPGQEHNMAGKDRMHLYKKLDQYLQQHL